MFLIFSIMVQLPKCRIPSLWEPDIFCLVGGICLTELRKASYSPFSVYNSAHFISENIVIKTFSVGLLFPSCILQTCKAFYSVAGPVPLGPCSCQCVTMSGQKKTNIMRSCQRLTRGVLCARATSGFLCEACCLAGNRDYTGSTKQFRYLPLLKGVALLFQRHCITASRLGFV